MKFNSALAILLLALRGSFAQDPAASSAVVAATPTPTPSSGVQIVNATCVPEIALYVNQQPLYPNFPQGLYTGDAPVPYTSARYRAVQVAARLASEEKLQAFAEGQQQTLLITGDFSRTDPPEDLPQPPQPGQPTPPARTFPPNVQFRLLSHQLAGVEKRLRYRFFNAMPRLPMLVRRQPDQATESVLPGAFLSYSGQKNYENYVVTVDGRETEVMIHQQGAERNCTVVFFLKNGQPAFARVFENTPESEKQAEAGENGGATP